MAKKTDSPTPKSEPALAEPKANLNPVQLIQDSKAELSKIIWPTRQALIGESIAVIAMVSLSATIIYLVNNFFSWAASQVFV